MHRILLLIANLGRAVALLGATLGDLGTLRAQHGDEGKPAALGFTMLARGAAVRCVAVPGATHVALVLVLRADAADREVQHALATALGIALAPAGAPAAGDAWQVRLLEDALQVAGLVPSAEAAPALARVHALLDGSTPLSDEALVVAISRARLVADDFVNVLPGPMLATRARRELCARGPLHGWPERYDFEPQLVRDRLRGMATPERAALVALGGGDLVALSRAFGAWADGLPAPVAPPTSRPASRPASSQDDAVRTHDRVDAPFASVAFRAVEPASTRYPAFLVAVEILRARAFAAFRAVRGGEMQARFPFVAYDPWEGSAVVVIGRRGKNGEDLEGPQSEIRALLRRLATEPVSPEEVARAGVALGRSLWLPPYTGAEADLVREPRLLLVRAATLAAAWSRKWPGDLTTSVQNLDTGLVRTVLGDLLREDGVVWSSLVPRAQGGDANVRR